MCYNRSGCFLHKQAIQVMYVVDDNDVGCHRSNMCVMCSTSVPTLFQYFFYDHIPTFLYIFHEMFFITCNILSCQHYFGGPMTGYTQPRAHLPVKIIYTNID